MFSGIVEERGQIQSIQNYNDHIRLRIRAHKVLEDIQLGDSIAVNGVCQTVEKFDNQSFTVAAFAETLAKTSIGQLKHGDAIHLERAVTPSTRLGGHIVQGHIDGLGHLREVRREQDNHYLRVNLPQALLNLCVLHGSICLDGVSLTIARLHEDGIEVNLIAHTWKHTMFSQRKPGDAINVECDILAKHLLRFAQRGLIRGLIRPLITSPEKSTQTPENEQRLMDLLRDW